MQAGPLVSKPVIKTGLVQAGKATTKTMIKPVIKPVVQEGQSRSPPVLRRSLRKYLFQPSLLSKWSPTALQPWSRWCLRRNPPKHVLLRQGFGGHPLRIPPRLDSRGFLRRRVNVPYRQFVYGRDLRALKRSPVRWARFRVWGN